MQDQPRVKTGGRIAGTPNKAGADAKAFALQLIAQPKYVAQLRRSFRDGTADVKLQLLMWHYAHGQPTKHVELVGKMTLEQIVAGSAAPGSAAPAAGAGA